MAVAYSARQRAERDARASALLAQCPDVGGFIRRGLRLNRDADALVYLRTALDPAPVITKAGEFERLLNAATLWLRRQGVRPGDVARMRVSPAWYERNSIAALPSRIGRSVPDTKVMLGPVGNWPGPDTIARVTGGQLLSAFPSLSTTVTITWASSVPSADFNMVVSAERRREAGVPGLGHSGGGMWR